MNLYFRLLWLFLTSPWKAKLNPVEPVSTALRCYPNDMDINFHMNNGRYFSLMDLGRLDVMLRCLPAWDLFTRRLRPIVIDETIRFRKSIHLFQKFEVVSHLVAWTEHDVYIEQKFIAKNQVCARAFVRGRVFNSLGIAIPAKELLSMMGYDGPQKELEGAVKAWAQLPRGG